MSLSHITWSLTSMYYTIIFIEIKDLFMQITNGTLLAHLSRHKFTKKIQTNTFADLYFLKPTLRLLNEIFASC